AEESAGRSRGFPHVTLIFDVPFAEPEGIHEYSSYDSYPSQVTKDGCKDSGNTAAFYLPLDDKGRAQGSTVRPGIPTR
ncbi:hypothetical protein ACFXPE_38065, partial [Streptomyces scopuliridis]|uniref:hypothetical protein n=1 Tax=Streptomyces scopuliridis TaxID=452529 RepID=UPI0036810EDE